jgi:hypothetical protein
VRRLRLLLCLLRTLVVLFAYKWIFLVSIKHILQIKGKWRNGLNKATAEWYNLFVAGSAPCLSVPASWARYWTSKHNKVLHETINNQNSEKLLRWRPDLRGLRLLLRECFLDLVLISRGNKTQHPNEWEENMRTQYKFRVARKFFSFCCVGILGILLILSEAYWELLGC